MAAALPLIACSSLVAAALVVRGERLRALLVLAALLGATVVLGVHVADADQVESLSDGAGTLVAGGVLGAAVVIGLAILFARVPAALPLAAVATIPFRIPLSIGSSTASLLIGLYLVIAAGALAWAVPLLRRRADPLAAPPPAAPGGLEWALAASLVLYAVGAAWSSDTDRALENVVFFYVPFAVLFVLLARMTWTRRVLASSLAVLCGLAAALAVVGYVEYATRHLLLNPKVIASNQVEDYFRVNSLFFDPNIFGRFLAVVLVLLVAWMLWRRRTAEVALGALVAAVIFGGLVLTLSQSSFAALLAGLSVLGGLRWNPRLAAVAAVCGLVVAAGAFVLATDLSSSSSANDATSGRKELVEGGVRLAAERPLAGWGSGSFSREYRRAEDVSAERATSASHTIPVTIAAEQGVLGLAAYVALLWFALRRLLRGAQSGVARAGIAAAFAALAVHTLLYASFLEDPLTWALLGAGTALALRPPGSGDEDAGGAADGRGSERAAPQPDASAEPA
jgi:O-antigen ligase